MVRYLRNGFKDEPSVRLVIQNPPREMIPQPNVPPGQKLIAELEAVHDQETILHIHIPNHGEYRGFAKQSEANTKNRRRRGRGERTQE